MLVTRRICWPGAGPPARSPGSCGEPWNGTVEEPRACRAAHAQVSHLSTVVLRHAVTWHWTHTHTSGRPTGHGHWRHGTADVDRSVRARGPVRTARPSTAENGSLTCATQGRQQAAAASGTRPEAGPRAGGRDAAALCLSPLTVSAAACSLRLVHTSSCWLVAKPEARQKKERKVLFGSKNVTQMVMLTVYV
jgi:hypothetical protein